ncbi:hypothetical protein PAEPH01_2017 [Pancytospora epiphaga]|nr:hypothetical protein PAEPH01_2017 [Pancytospora epiphaga]
MGNVAAATLAVNISFIRSIGTSPYILKFGKHPTFDIDRTLSATAPRVHISTLLRDRQAIFKKYKKEISKGTREIKMNLERNTPVLVFHNPPGNKLKAKWIDGFIITDKVYPDAYLVSNGTRTYRLNKSHVKEDFSRSGSGNVVLQSPPVPVLADH